MQKFYCHFLDNFYILFMTTVSRTSIKSSEPTKYLSISNRLKTINVKHRNYSSSKLLKSYAIDPEFPSNILQSHKSIEGNLPKIENYQVKNYCLGKFKSSINRQKIEVIRKNASLKSFKRDEDIKIYNRGKVEDIKNQQIECLIRQDKNYNGQLQSCKSIPAKKRFQLLKKNPLKIILNKQQKKKEKEKQSKINQVSFQKGLDQNAEQQKVSLEAKICSENVLSGLRKSSATKIKSLVINPFERFEKYQKVQKQKNSHIIKQNQNFTESQIFGKMDESFPSQSQQQQLSSLLQLI